MNEAEWNRCTEPEEMLAFLRDSGRLSERKARLFAVACCRTIWPLVRGGHKRRAVEVAERYADGEANDDQLKEAAQAAAPKIPWPSDAHSAASGFYVGSLLDAEAPCAAYAAYTAVSPFTAADLTLYFTHRTAQAAATAIGYSSSESAAKRHRRRVWSESQERAYAAQCRLLRDFFGPLPFREVRIDPAWLTWNGGSVRRLAEAAYAERQLPSGHLDHARLAVLGDALEESGCPDAELLGHLRGPGPHYRGCFALDAVLGRS